MMGLKTARVMIIETESLESEGQVFEDVLEEVIQRLPAGCEVGFGPKTEMDQKHAAQWVKASIPKSTRVYYAFGQVLTADADVVEKAAEGRMQRKGVKSGSKIDYRWNDEGKGLEVSVEQAFRCCKTCSIAA